MGTQKGRKHFGESISDEVLKLRSDGLTHREISELFGFESKEVIERLLERHRKKQRFIAAGGVPKSKGRPRKRENSQDQTECELKRLRMENQLLRSFLSEPGRR